MMKINGVLLIAAAFSVAGPAVAGIVHNDGTAYEDSLAVSFQLLDSLGNPVPRSSGDSLWFFVYDPGGTLVYTDSARLLSDAKITYRPLNFRAKNLSFMSYKRAIADIDGAGVNGTYKWTLVAGDSSLALLSTYNGEFQVVTQGNLAGILDSINRNSMVSGDAAAADNLEAMLDGTGGVDLSLRRLRVNNTSSAGPAVSCSSQVTSAAGFYTTGTLVAPHTEVIRVKAGGTGNQNGFWISGLGSAHGIDIDGGSNGSGIVAYGYGAGSGIKALSQTSGQGIYAAAGGTGAGLRVESSNGSALYVVSGAEFGDNEPAVKIEVVENDSAAVVLSSSTKVPAGFRSVLAASDSINAHAPHSDNWAAVGGGGTGAIPCTLSVAAVIGTDTVAVASAFVRVYNAGETATAAFGTTDASGRAIFALEATTYHAYGYLSGYIFAPQPTIVAVGTSGGHDTLWATPFDPGTPATAELCRVYGWVSNLSGNELSGVMVRARIPESPLRYQNVVISPYERQTTTDSAGHWFMDLYPSSVLTPNSTRYEFEIRLESGAVLRRRISVPDSASWLLTW
ncbi:MAG: hypothetical protein AB1792_11155 [Candidatus Zixiibacteriota bacterium]